MSLRKNLDDIELEIGRFLAVLNNDLEKIEQIAASARNAYKPEERKTLEVLDNMLAEFDDWPSVETEDMDLSNENGTLEMDVFAPDDRVLSDFQKVSLPAIPIRSPTTRLSESDNTKLLSHQPLSSTRNDCTRDIPQLAATPFVVVQESDIAMSSATTDSEDVRIQELRAKFSKVRELLKKNAIKILDVEPPSFIPPPPPSSLHRGLRSHSCEILSESDDSTSSRQSPTVEDIPNLLPTDVLLRPQFGMTYSLEDDLPPGVKEILRTSTPKSDVSASSFSREFGRLSTFSSQSELEVSSIPDKVPLTSFKSLTLPHGLDRFPFYSHEESSHWKINKPSSQRSITTHMPIRDAEDERKTKKSHFSFRKFSRKSKNGSAL